MVDPKRAPKRTLYDDLGTEVVLTGEVHRVVSLVPSLTESVAVTAPGLLVGATDWCSHPADLDVTRVGGTKSPAIERIRELRPDLVLANEEENRPADLAALRAAGIPVWVTVIRDLPQAFVALRRMLDALLPGVGAGSAAGPGAEPGAGPRWLVDAERAWAGLRPGRRRRAVIPVWRRPWMVVGRDTFAGDLLARLGVRNLYAGHADRYPKTPVDELLACRPDLVVLPDEPYRFTADDGPECFPGIDCALVSGRHLTWYGPSLAEAPEVLSRQLAASRAHAPGHIGWSEPGGPRGGRAPR